MINFEDKYFTKFKFTDIQILKDDTIADLGNIMRSKRNVDLYSGGIEITEKECDEYIKFVDDILMKVKKIVS